MVMKDEIKEHLLGTIIPFWKALRDREYGGYYGFMDQDLKVEKKAVKGCILNSRILWFFSNAYTLLRDESLLDEARHGFDFMKKHCMDRENGGIFWSVTFEGRPEDETKHTYNQAFAIYALSSYYEASGDKEALSMAKELFHIIEEKCTDGIGYREAFDRKFQEIENDKLSENGIIAQRTMNTLLHVFEAYTELYCAAGMAEVKERLMWILDTFAEKVYNPELHRQEVFFDTEMNSLIDLHSYGHDIEAAWLKEPGKREYLDAAQNQWEFIENYVIDKREGSEWFHEVTQEGVPYQGGPIVEPWKCPYHNGRMCLEVIKRCEG